MPSYPGFSTSKSGVRTKETLRLSERNGSTRQESLERSRSLGTSSGPDELVIGVLHPHKAVVSQANTYVAANPVVACPTFVAPLPLRSVPVMVRSAYGACLTSHHARGPHGRSATHRGSILSVPL